MDSRWEMTWKRVHAIVSWILFDNPAARAYGRILDKFTDFAGAHPAPWIVFGVVAIVAYLIDFGVQATSFSGSWLGADFLTLRTVLPWVGYVLVCLFIIPLFATARADALAKRRAEYGAAHPDVAEPPKQDVNARGVAVAVAIFTMVFLPYAALMIGTGHGAGVSAADLCTVQTKSECQGVEDGAVPATEFRTMSPPAIRAKAQVCIVCGFNTQRMRTVEKSAGEVEKVLDEIRKKEQDQH